MGYGKISLYYIIYRKLTANFENISQPFNFIAPDAQNNFMKVRNKNAIYIILLNILTKEFHGNITSLSLVSHTYFAFQSNTSQYP